MKFIKYTLITLFIMMVASTSIFVVAQKKSDKLKSDKQKIASEIANTQKVLDQIRKNKTTSLQQVQVLRNQISNREAFITELNKEIYTLEMELALNVKLSKDMDKKLEYMKSDYSRVVYLAYKNRRSMDKLSFILSSEDFSQMYRRIRYYNLFTESVVEQVAQIETTQEEIAAKTLEIEQVKASKLAVLEGKELEVIKLESDRRSKARATESLKKKEKELVQEIRKKQKKQRELDAAIKKAISDEIRLANAAKAKKTGAKTPAKSNKELMLTPEEAVLNTSFVNNKGRLPWPVLRGQKISNFGKYPHPDVPSVMIENRGIDILVEANTPVRAVFEGEVTATLDMMGTKVVMVRHGEYLTVYQNLATVSVVKGDKVTTKQNIGTVAKNTLSNAYELHFEVWKNNTYLNPSLWIVK